MTKIVETSPKDQPAKQVKPFKLSNNIYAKITDCINLFKRISLHYSDSINDTKMQNLRMIRNTKFNISFSFARSDTCRVGDRFTTEVNIRKKKGNLENELTTIRSRK